jgi:hypothetical protein
MAIPTTGPVSMGMIRNELGMPTTTNFSLTNATVPGSPGYPPVLNPNSPVIPNISTPYSMSEWRGYSSTTLNWYNNGSFPVGGIGGQGRLQIYINGVLIIDSINPVSSPPNPIFPFDGTSGTIVINPLDTFYAIFTPITFGFFSNFSSTLFTHRLTSPFGLFNYITLDSKNNTSTPSFFTPLISTTQTATIQPINLGVFEINGSC